MTINSKFKIISINCFFIIFYCKIRKLCASILLSDPNSYEGGELEFHTGDIKSRNYNCYLKSQNAMGNSFAYEKATIMLR